jgi:hypothetical protein
MIEISCQLDAEYIVGFERYEWMFLLVGDGTRLNFGLTSISHLLNFLNDPVQLRATLSEVYTVRRVEEGQVILSSGLQSYRIAAETVERLRAFLDDVTITSHPEEATHDQL